MRANERFWKSRSGRRTHYSGWIFHIFVAAFIVFPLLSIPISFVQKPAFALAWRTQGMAALWPVSFVLIPAGFLALLWFGAPLLQGRSFRDSPLSKRPITASIEREGIRGDSLIPWSRIQFIEETATHIFIAFDENSVFIIPRRAFESDFAATQFAAKCRDQHQHAASV